MSHYTPVRINRDELKDILQNFEPSTHAHKIVSVIAATSGIPSKELKGKTGSSNPSLITKQFINPRIERFGLAVLAEKPLNPIRDEYGIATPQHVWRLYRIENEGNIDG